MDQNILNISFRYILLIPKFYKFRFRQTFGLPEITSAKVEVDDCVSQIKDVKPITIDGEKIKSAETFYLQIDDLFTKDLDWKTGHDLNAFNDILWVDLVFLNMTNQ